MKRLYILIITCFFCMQVQAQTPTANTQEVLVITRALLAAPVTEKSIPSMALPKGKVEFSVKQFYARKVLKTQGEVRLSAGEKKIFRAGEAILLEPGFEVDSTVEFTAEIARPEKLTEETLAISTQTADTLLNALPEARAAAHADMTASSPEAKFTLFPNPVSERLYVRYHLTDEAPVTVSLLTITGAVIQTLQHSKQQAAGAYEVGFSVSDVQAGIYLVSLQIGKLTFTQRIIVQ